MFRQSGGSATQGGKDKSGFRRYEKCRECLDESILLGIQEINMKKLKHETELVHEAILAGVTYAEKRGAAIFEPTDSAADKILYIYRLLVHDKLIQPLPEDQVSQQSMRHKLAIWYSKQLPKDHHLLN